MATASPTVATGKTVTKRTNAGSCTKTDAGSTVTVSAAEAARLAAQGIAS